MRHVDKSRGGLLGQLLLLVAQPLRLRRPHREREHGRRRLRRTHHRRNVLFERQRLDDDFFDDNLTRKRRN
jgi:hypothetical protein